MATIRLGAVASKVSWRYLHVKRSTWQPRKSEASGLRMTSVNYNSLAHRTTWRRRAISWGGSKSGWVSRGRGGGGELVVKGYVDASFDTDLDDSKSQTGYVYILNGGAVSCAVASKASWRDLHVKWSTWQPRRQHMKQSG